MLQFKKLDVWKEGFAKKEASVISETTAVESSDLCSDAIEALIVLHVSMHVYGSLHIMDSHHVDEEYRITTASLKLAPLIFFFLTLCTASSKYVSMSTQLMTDSRPATK